MYFVVCSVKSIQGSSEFVGELRVDLFDKKTDLLDKKTDLVYFSLQDESKTKNRYKQKIRHTNQDFTQLFVFCYCLCLVVLCVCSL